MKRGAHLLAAGPSGVVCRLVREFMFLLDGISVGDKTQERERVHPCNVCDKAFKSLPTPNQHKIFQHSALCEKPLKKWLLEFASPSGDYLTFLCFSLSLFIVNLLILQNTFWSYKTLFSFSSHKSRCIKSHIFLF